MTGPTQLIGTSSDSSNLLNRGDPSPASFPLSPVQAQVDQTVRDFSHQVSDWKTLCAMVAGGLAYRWARMGAMTSKTGTLASLAVGLGTEGTTFEMTHRSLSQITGEGPQNPNLWKWNGSGGLRQGLLSSWITFGSLKGAGRLAQGENIIVQHLLQDTGMVLAHNISGQWGITPRPMGTLTEQFFQAETTNLQLGAGTALGHALSGGKLLSMEKGLDFQIQSKETNGPNLFSHLFSQPALAMAGEKVLNQNAVEVEKIPTIFAMDAPSDGRGGQRAVRKTDLEDYKSTKRTLALSAPDDRADASTLKILRRTTYLNFKKVLRESAQSNLQTVASLIRLAKDGHRWAFDVLTEAAKTGLHAAKAVEGLAQRGYGGIYDSLTRIAVSQVHLIEMLERLGVEGHQRALILMKDMDAAAFVTETRTEQSVRGLYLLARNKNQSALEMLIQWAKTFPPAVNALFELALAGRQDAEKALASLDSQWIVRASQKNGSVELDHVLYQLAKHGNGPAQMALMEAGREKCGALFKMAQLSEEGLPWATEWMMIQAETSPLAVPLLKVLAKEGHRNAQEILRKKEASERDDSEGNGAGALKSFAPMDLGLSTLFGEKRFHENGIFSSGFSLPDIFPEIGQGGWSKALFWIGLGILVVAGIGISVWRRRSKQEFLNQIPPALNDSQTSERNQIAPSDEGDSAVEAQEELPSPLTWSRPAEPTQNGGKVISLFDYREDMELVTVYQGIANSFSSKKDLGEFLRGTMVNSDPYIRERHLHVYEIYIKSLLRMHSPRFSPWMIEEIQKGMATINGLRRDPVLNVKSTASVVLHRLRDFVGKYLPSLSEKN